MISAMTSLTFVRTKLLEFLFARPPYADLRDMLDFFRDSCDIEGAHGVAHLQTVSSSFENLLRVFQKTTLSPGIKAFHDVREIVDNGQFVIQTNVPLDRMLCLEYQHSVEAVAAGAIEDASKGKSAAGAAAAGGSPTAAAEQMARVENLEFLLDLRSKILMTEVPEEMEREMGMARIVAAFVQQMQIVFDVRDQLHRLFTLGHPLYQRSTVKFVFTLDGAAALLAERQRLVDETQRWDALVAAARAKFYFLNYFTMRELLRLSALLRALTGDALAVLVDDGSGKGGASAAVAASSGGGSGKINVSGGKQAAAVAAAAPAIVVPPPAAAPPPIEAPPESFDCEACTFNNRAAKSSCEMCGTARPAWLSDLLREHARLVRAAANGGEASPASAAGGSGGAGAHGSGVRRERKVTAPTQIFADDGSVSRDPLGDLVSLLHLVTSASIERAHMHRVLGAAIHAPASVASHGSHDSPQGAQGKQASQAQAFLESVGATLQQLFAQPADAAVFPFAIRAVPQPDGSATNRSDMMIFVKNGGKEGEQALPIFCAQTERPGLMLESVFSVFVRRGRLPEPGEILHCSAETSQEDVDLLLHRYFLAKRFGRGAAIFCMADVHNLTYALQCSVIDRLAVFKDKFGVHDASTLLLVSGKPRQLIINALSAHRIELPPLDLASQRRAILASAAFCGELFSIVSDINGGGKSDHIQTEISRRQREATAGASAGAQRIVYRKIPFRESSSAHTLVAALSRDTTPHTRYAFHVDIGHIICDSANTLLFELLVVGVLKSTALNQSYFRRAADVFFLEIPNSRGELTRRALRVCELFQSIEVRVNAASLSLVRPYVADISVAGSQIVVPEYEEMKFVCSMLRAFDAGKFKPGSSFDPAFAPEADAPIGGDECFALLVKHCPCDGVPSWLIFHSFLGFMYTAFKSLNNYSMLNFYAQDGDSGLQTLKNSFVGLVRVGIAIFRVLRLCFLIATCADFIVFLRACFCHSVHPVDRDEQGLFAPLGRPQRRRLGRRPRRRRVVRPARAARGRRAAGAASATLVRGARCGRAVCAAAASPRTLGRHGRTLQKHEDVGGFRAPARVVGGRSRRRGRGH